MKNKWYYTLFICIGIVLGGFVSELTKGVKWLSFLSWGLDFGIDPVNGTLGTLFSITFGFNMHLTIGMIICIVLAIVIGRLLKK